jgi:hypothetical protein
MNLLTKIAIVLFCFSLCGAGVFIASSPDKGHEPEKTNVIPVKNRDAARFVWIEV